MNRWLASLALVLGLSTFACAAGVEDPEPTPTVAEPQREAPKQVLSGEIEEPGIDLGGDLSLGGVTELGPRQTPPLPVPEG
jgi:hypothetical protein